MIKIHVTWCRNNKWVFFLHVLLTYIYFSNPFVSPKRDLIHYFIMNWELKESWIWAPKLLNTNYYENIWKIIFSGKEEIFCFCLNITTHDMESSEGEIHLSGFMRYCCFYIILEARLRLITLLHCCPSVLLGRKWRQRVRPWKQYVRSCCTMQGR